MIGIPAVRHSDTTPVKNAR